MAKPFLSVIIPAYNEEKRLPRTLSSLSGWLDGQGYAREIIVVNDGSSDATAETVRKYASATGGLKLIDNAQNRGKGASVRQGMLAAGGEWRLFMDADNSTPISEFPKLLSCLLAGCDVAIGSRAVKGAKLSPPQPLRRRLLGKAGNLLIQALLTPGIWDTQCGFKCFSAEAAMSVFSRTIVNGWGFDAEALAVAKKSGYKIKEIPVDWSNDESTHVRPIDYARTLFETVAAGCRLRFGFYGREAAP